MPLTQLLFYLLFGAALFIGGGAVLHTMPPPAQQEHAEEKAEEETASNAPSAQPDGDGTPPERESAPAPAMDEPAAPSFDVVRIEKDGTGVIAGRAEPEWTVIVGTEETEIARAVADRGGEWVVLLEEPLAPGEHALGLHAVAPGAHRGLTSEQQVAVSVAKPDTSEGTIVALSEPGRGTRVMSSESEEGETQEQQQRQTPADQKKKETPAPAARDEEDDAAAETETAAAEEGKEETAPDERESAGADAETPSTERERETAAAGTETPAEAAEGTGAGEPASREQGETAAAEGEMDESASESTPPRAPEKVVAFTTVDYERGDAGEGTLYLTGEATAGSRVILYLNNERLGEAVAGPNGRWSFKDAETLSPDGAHSLRADAVQSDGQVASRAEVAFSPPSVPEPELAAAPETPQTETQSPRGEGHGEEALEPKTERERQVAVVSEEHEKEPADDRSAVASPRETEAAVPDSEAPGSEGSALEADSAARDEAGAPQERTEQAEQIEAGQTEREGEGEQDAGSTETAEEEESLPFSQKRSIVVRRGDTLWHIARHRYGRGIRYTVIYQSNRDQIRDPDLIYPEQEFRLPDR